MKEEKNDRLQKGTITFTLLVSMLRFVLNGESLPQSKYITQLNIQCLSIDFY